MPMVIPVIAAFAAGAGGVAALGAAATMVGVAGTIATVAAYATIAGAVLTGVGAITGSKDLMKIGAVLSIGGGIGSLGAGLASAGATAGEESAAASAANAEGATPASLTGDVSGEAAGQVADTGAVASPVPSGNAVVTPTDPNAPAPTAPTPDAPNAVVAPAAPGTTSTTFTTDASGAITNGPASGTGGNLGPDYAGGATGPGGPNSSIYTSPTDSALAKVTDAGKALTNQDITSWWEKAQQAGGSVAKFIQDNPALVKVGGDALGSMFGPAAEKLDWEKSIYNRARTNLNAPVVLSYKKG